MIVCYYSELDEGHEEALRLHLMQLPPKIRNEILNKKETQDVYRSACGYLLLQKVLEHFDLQHRLSLDDLHYTSFSRPFFTHDFDFNISHSEKLVICCGTLHGKIGIDLEYIDQATQTKLYKEYFTTLEWKSISDTVASKHQDPSKGKNSPNNRFFNLWTRKEAVLKARGMGIFKQLDQLDVSRDQVTFEDEVYFITRLDLNPNYSCHLASTAQKDIHIFRLEG